MSDTFKKETLEEELKSAKRNAEVLAIKQRFFSNKFAVKGNQQNEYNLRQITGAQKEQDEWIKFLESQLK